MEGRKKGEGRRKEKEGKKKVESKKGRKESSVQPKTSHALLSLVDNIDL